MIRGHNSQNKTAQPVNRRETRPPDDSSRDVRDKGPLLCAAVWLASFAFECERKERRDDSNVEFLVWPDLEAVTTPTIDRTRVTLLPHCFSRSLLLCSRLL